LWGVTVVIQSTQGYCHPRENIFHSSTLSWIELPQSSCELTKLMQRWTEVVERSEVCRSQIRSWQLPCAWGAGPPELWKRFSLCWKKSSNGQPCLVTVVTRQVTLRVTGLTKIVCCSRRSSNHSPGR